jgi:hypothetical protein
MALIPWHKDKETKEWYYYDTDDLNDEEYARVCEIDKLVKNISSFNERCKLWDEQDQIIKNALARGVVNYDYHRKESFHYS